MGQKVARKYGIEMGKEQIISALVCPLLFRIQVQHEIMEREVSDSRTVSVRVTCKVGETRRSYKI